MLPYHYFVQGSPYIAYNQWQYPFVPYPQHAFFTRAYQEVDPTLFNESAIEMKNLMKDARLVLAKIADSKEFAYKVMNAAQLSNMDEVERLINSTGIHSKVNTSYDPDGINMKFDSKDNQSECCKLTIALRWR